MLKITSFAGKEAGLLIFFNCRSFMEVVQEHQIDNSIYFQNLCAVFNVAKFFYVYVSPEY